MDRTKDIERIEREVDNAIRNLELQDALEFVEELETVLEGKADGLRDDIKAQEEDEADGA